MPNFKLKSRCIPTRIIHTEGRAGGTRHDVVDEEEQRSARQVLQEGPGEQTANYIDSVLARLTVFGAIYLTLICLLPFALINFAGISQTIAVGGTSVLIIVVVLMDFMAQVQSHMMSSQYASLMKKANLKNYKR